MKTLAMLLFAALVSQAATLTVGPGKQFATPCAAVEAAADGDTIEIQAGEYLNDFCVVLNKGLTVRGVGTGRAHIRGNVKPTKYQGAAVWVVDAKGKTSTFENMEFSGGVGNGNTAALRFYSLTNGVLKNVYLHDSENCLMQDVSADLLAVEDSLVENCGNGDQGGMTHNIYVSALKEFRFIRSISRNVRMGGHLIKSRALKTVIDGSTLDGNGSAEVDFTQGGDCQILNSTITQRADADNLNIIFAGMELPQYATTLVIKNTTINDYRQNGRMILGFLGIPVSLQNVKYFFSPGGALGVSNYTDLGGNVFAPISAAPPGTTSVIRWRILSGTLPPGLALAADGAVTGTPTAAGTYKVIVEASSDGAAPASREYTITIAASAPPKIVSITTTELPAGTVGQVYSARLVATL